MADKEATIYIIDVGKSMRYKNLQRPQSDLEWAMVYIWDKVTSIMAMDRKTTYQGIIGLRTDGTSHRQEDEDGFENITVFQELAALSLTDIKRIQHLIAPSNTNRGDAISAIVVAIDMIEKHCKKLKYRRKIVLVTNGSGGIEDDEGDIRKIAEKLTEDDIELVVLGVDFDSQDFGFKEEDKSPNKAKNEATLRSLAEGSGGVFGTLAEAVAELGEPRLKSTKPVPSYKDNLLLGDPKYGTALSVFVERYPRTMIRKPPTASSYVQVEAKNGQTSIQSSATLISGGDGDTEMVDANNLASVKNTRQYEIIDETGVNGKRHVSQDELAKGYEYGRTAVHLSESDLQYLKLDSSPKLEIVGFIPSDNYEQFMGLSRTNMIVARPGDTEAAMALSSLIHALAEVESYAIARLVVKQDKAPLLLLLAPLIEPDYECLVDVELPYAEDVRTYKFPPLDKVVTVSGKVLKEHRNLPNESLMKAMSDYVDHMDLSNFGTNDDGESADFMNISDVYSPVLHRIDQVIRFRAINPTEPIPPPYDILTKFSKPPTELVDAAKSYLGSLVTASNIKKVPPKKMGRRQGRDDTKPVSGLNVQDLISKNVQLRVTPDRPIPSFKQMLDQTEDPDGIHKAASQLGAIIENQVKESIGNINYGQVVEEMRTFKEYMNDYEEPEEWNKWVRGFKTMLDGGQLKGDHKELWFEMKKARLGLIEGGRSGVSSEEAKAFLGKY